METHEEQNQETSEEQSCCPSYAGSQAWRSDERLKLLIQLRDRKLLSDHSLLSAFGYNYDVEKKQRAEEKKEQEESPYFDVEG